MTYFHWKASLLGEDEVIKMHLPSISSFSYEQCPQIISFFLMKASIIDVLK